MKKEEGFTLLELLFVLSMIVILIGLSIYNYTSYNDRNRALQIKSEAQLALNVSNAYFLSTSNYQKANLEKNVSDALQEYQMGGSAKKTFEVIEQRDGSGNIIKVMIQIHAEIDDRLTIKGELDPRQNKMKLKGIGDVNRIDSLKKNGVLDE